MNWVLLMEDASPATRSTSLIITLAAIVIVLAGVKYAEAIISPFLIALFISAISGPAMFWLTEKKVPAGLAVSLIILSIIILGFFISSILGSSLQNFSDKLPEYQSRLQEITQSIAVTLSKFGIHLELEELRKILNFGKVMSFVSSTFNQVLGALTNIFLILMMVIFLLLELSCFSFKFKHISHNPAQTMARLGHVSGTMGRYFKIKAFTSLITALPIIVVLSIMGIDFPILWGMVVFLLNFIPNIGSIIAAIPVILLALIQFGFLAAGEVALLYLVMNSLIGSFLEPRLMGRSLGLSTLVVFLSLVFWGWMLGPIGMFLSIPLTMTFKIIMDSHENTRWVSILLNNE